ncbi:asparagine synthase (glutamine-hydrolyzing) [Tunturibacter psychrotolerans]|uniref:asparagine synthase (glutamine-hydrolyzing) n=1 Tax=Tunturiibacter psychrotolerans TaxID=3069686 RepID=A0AAU7ZNE7_9BACT
MCGICGQYNFGDRAPVSRQSVERMAKSISHRGPDDEGYYVAGPLGLGFRRLSIIDLEGGHQPMSDQEELVWVIFNGEIYNFPDLKRELEAFGHLFRTKSDTEVIVHGYKQWGDDVLNHLNGMFGLAIWDVLQERLVVARDPFGIKLIYYKIDRDHLYFGSEIRAIQSVTEEQPDVDPNALNMFLRYRYTPSPYTMFKGIRKLAAGTMLVCEKGTGSLRRWYRYQPAPFSPMKSIGEAQEELLELYKQSIKKHLLSDVSVGLLLSGGIDSGLLLALMNLYGKSWRTYTVGYGSSFSDDELTDAGETAALFSSQHTEVTLDKSTFEGMLQTIVSCLEEPIASSSIVPMYFLCKRAREEVKVALIGQGPDELFAGYRRHLGVRYGAYWMGIPSWIRSSIASGITTLPRNETLKRGLYSLDVKDRLRRYQHVLSLLPGNEIDGLFQDEMLEHYAGDEILECWKDLFPLMSETDELGGFQFLEMRSTLPDELLMFGDKLSMAHGLEVRVPYLDKDLVEYVERLPANFKVRNGSQKWLHRQVCQDLLPKRFMRRKKRGFAVNVVDDWFRSSVNGKTEQILMDNESHLYRYLRPSAVQRIFKQHRSGRNDYHKILFSLVVFEEWLRVQLPSQSKMDSVVVGTH